MSKFVIAIILVLTGPASVLACSYSFSHPNLGALHHHSDLVFEGEVTAVYVGGEQVSTNQFDKAVSRLWKTTEILFKIKPTKMYEGEPTDQIAVLSGFYADTLCGGGLYGDVDQKLWGANHKDGRLEFDPFYHQYFNALRTVEKYRNALTGGLRSSPTSPSVQRLLERDLIALDAFIAEKPPSLGAAFFSTPTELAEMPIQLFEARMEFLAADYALRREFLIMSTANVMHAKTEKEAK